MGICENRILINGIQNGFHILNGVLDLFGVKLGCFNQIAAEGMNHKAGTTMNLARQSRSPSEIAWSQYRSTKYRAIVRNAGSHPDGAG